MLYKIKIRLLLKFKTFSLYPHLKVDTLNATVVKLEASGKSRRRGGDIADSQLTILQNDIDSLQTASAKAEASLSGTQQIILKNLRNMETDIDQLKKQTPVCFVLYYYYCLIEN